MFFCHCLVICVFFTNMFVYVLWGLILVGNNLLFFCGTWIWLWLLCFTRVVQRRLSSLPQVRMHPCLLLVSMRRNTSQSLILFPMLAALPTALLPWPRFISILFKVLVVDFINFSKLLLLCFPVWFLLIVVFMLNFLQVIHDRFGIVEGLMTTVHSITGKLLFIFPGYLTWARGFTGIWRILS